jgi:hypothetical protein
MGRPFGVRKPGFADRDYIRSGVDEVGDLLFSNYINTCGTLVRRSVLERAGLFRTEITHGEDWDLWLRISQVASVAHVAEQVVVYRRHEANTTRYHDLTSWVRVHAAILERTLSEPVVAQRYGHLRRAVYGQLMQRAALRAYGNRQMRDSRRYAMKGLLHRRRHVRARDVRSAVSLILKSLIPAGIRPRVQRSSRARHRAGGMPVWRWLRN